MGNEVERDMKVFHIEAPKDKATVQDYLNRIASIYPLLGTAPLPPKSFETVEKYGQQAIKLALEYGELKSFAHLAILLTIVHYAKSWEHTESSGFWAYICEQLGYKYSETLYSVLTESVKTACERYSRVFLKEANGDNSYYSTVLAHAIAPSKSFFALLDFLLRFYRNNLDYSVSLDDPAIERMTEVLRERCKGAIIEQDEDIRGNVSGIQAGIRALLAQRPLYMQMFLVRLLQKIDQILSGEELPSQNYVNELITQWYVGKITEPAVKRSAPVHKRTTDIAFSYGKIRIAYVLDTDGEPAIRIPSIRLNGHDNPIVVVYSGDVDVYRQQIAIYGNDYACTSEETIIPLSDVSDVDFRTIRVELIIARQQIYSSSHTLQCKALLFRDGKAITNKTIDVGNCLLFAPKGAKVAFQGDIDRKRRPYFAQLYDVYLQGDSSVFVDDALICFSRPPMGSLRFRLPQSSAEYIIAENAYPIYAREAFSVNVIGQFQGEFSAVTDTGDTLTVTSEGNDVYSVSLPASKGCHIVSLLDRETERLLDETRFYLVDSFNVAFDKTYYLERTEDGILSFMIEDEQFEVPLGETGRRVKQSFRDGEVVIQVPRITLTLDGQPLPKNAIWKSAVTPSSRIHVNCSDSLNVSLVLGEQALAKSYAPGGFEYAFGNAVQATDTEQDKLDVVLFVSGEKHSLFHVVFKPCLISEPLFNLNENTLTWLNPATFIGDSSAKLEIFFRTKRTAIPKIVIGQGERILCTDFPVYSEIYAYEFVAVTETTFGESKVSVCKDRVLFGNRAEVVFRDATLRVSQVIEDGNYIEIKPFFIENIAFIGKENLGYTDLSGEYPHYTAQLYFSTRSGKRYFTDFNPLDIYLVNENARRLHITFDQGEGLLIDKSGEYMPELYKHRDPPPKLAKWFSFPDYFEYTLEENR